MIATQHPGGCVSPELEFLLLPISLASLLLTTLAFPLFRILINSLLPQTESHPPLTPSSSSLVYSCLSFLWLSLNVTSSRAFPNFSILGRLSFLISKHFLFQIQEEALPLPLALTVSRRHRPEGTDLFALFTVCLAHNPYMLNERIDM